MNIFNDFELLDFINLDTMMWGGGTGAGGYRIQVNNGVYLLSGTSVNLKSAKMITAEGIFSVVGTSINFRKTYILPIIVSNFTLNGTSVNLVRFECRTGCACSKARRQVLFYTGKHAGRTKG